MQKNYNIQMTDRSAMFSDVTLQELLASLWAEEGRSHTVRCGAAPNYSAPHWRPHEQCGAVMFLRRCGTALLAPLPASCASHRCPVRLRRGPGVVPDVPYGISYIFICTVLTVAAPLRCRAGAAPHCVGWLLATAPRRPSVTGRPVTVSRR